MALLRADLKTRARNRFIGGSSGD